MGLLDLFKRGRKGKEEEPLSGGKVEYHEILYSKDSPAEIISPRTPPRREWEHISSIEEKIDKLDQQTHSEEEITDIEKKIDELLSRQNK